MRKEKERGILSIVRGRRRGSSERRHRRKRLGIRIEREKIGGRKKCLSSRFLSRKRCNSLEPSNWRGERTGMFPDFCYITI